jgi:uncharacterized protein involved in exopolysaccharide biosynthesis
MIPTNLGNGPDKKSDPTLRDLLTPLFRRKRLFALTFGGTVLGAAIAAFLLSSQYEAKMEILVNQERLDPMVSSESTLQTPAAPPPVTDEQINSEVELLQSPDLLQEVVIANDLQNLEKKGLLSRILPQKNNNWYVSRATDHLGKRLKIDNVTKTNLIEVSYKSSDPHLAYSVLQKLSSSYLAKHLAVHRPQGSYSFFASQTDKYRQALEDSEARLAAFGKESGAVASDLERAEMAQQVVNATGALHAARQAIASDKQRIEDVEARMKNTPDRSSTQQLTAPAQSLLQQLRADLLTAEIKKTQLLLKYDPSYPLVREAEQEIDQTQAAIADASKQQYVNQTTDRDPTYELMREDVAKTKADLASQFANERAVESSIQSMQGQMVDLDQKALKQADLTREVKANEANYLLYLSKREQERTSDALDEKRIGNVAIAIPPMLPVLPATSPVLVLLVGLVLAGFVSTTAALVAEYLNPSLRTPSEVLEVLRIPVLASVPKQTA